MTGRKPPRAFDDGIFAAAADRRNEHVDSAAVDPVEDSVDLSEVLAFERDIRCRSEIRWRRRLRGIVLTAAREEETKADDDGKASPE